MPLILSFSPLILRDGLWPPQDDGEKERSQCVSTSKQHVPELNLKMKWLRCDQHRSQNIMRNAMIAGKIPFYFMVGMLNSEPSFMPEGQREVMVLVLVYKRMESGPCWFKSPKEERFQPPKV